ncbi:14923_t:CDS:2 [Racocetra persica]|uniref:14923_t:CDS:1 n=1 Tax=Racocetra persica TaxID=160502 RepID=A0ACA9MG58_9GLOM|nr:14923_t:CDS:2 [Racocetra persica]
MQRKALGKAAVIGSLYDATTDTFSKTTILRIELLFNSVSRVNIPKTIALDGSVKYLDDIKDSFRSIKGTLVYKVTSVEENLDIYREYTKGYTYTRSNSTVGIEGKLYNTINRFSIKLLGDVIPNTIPQSVEDAKIILSKLSSYIKKNNDGKGVPIEYILYPLTEFSKILSQHSSVDRMIIELSEDTTLRIEQIFIDLFKSKQKFNDLFNDVKSISKFIPDDFLMRLISMYKKFT